MDTAYRHEFGTDGLSAAVLAQGAELCALTRADGLEILWPAAPAWPRHAPVLFPIVGRLAGDTLRHRGQTHRLTQHGFARDMRFAWAERGPDGCRLVLRDTPVSRAAYPFGFVFEVAYRAAGASLSVTYTVTNPGEDVLPVSFGAHPAFRWPLLPGTAKEDHVVIFEADETAPLRRVKGGLLTAADRASPVVGRRLPLAPALFADDALIFEAPNSRWVRYASGARVSITVAWDGFSQLGVWSRAGGDFLCIEPWQGMASPEGFDGEFAEKPWLMQVPPGQKRSASWCVALA
jgi:galactose mutarotase-like enzyme